jgi:hypothetical protein
MHYVHCMQQRKLPDFSMHKYCRRNMLCMHCQLRHWKLRGFSMWRRERLGVFNLCSCSNERCLHWLWNKCYELPVDLQQRILSKRIYVWPVSCWKLVLWQCEKHVSNKHRLCCPIIKPKPVHMQDRVLRKRFNNRDKPVSYLHCLILLPWRQQQHERRVPSKLHVPGRGLCACTVLLQARIPAHWRSMPALPCRWILSQRQLELMSREFILSNRILRCFVVCMQRRVLRIEWSLCAVHRKLLLHRGYVQAGMCCRCCIHPAKHKLHCLLLRQGLPGRCQCSLLAMCRQHVVLDRCAKHMPSKDLVAAFVQLHVQLHLRAWIHGP